MQKTFSPLFPDGKVAKILRQTTVLGRKTVTMSLEEGNDELLKNISNSLISNILSIFVTNF